MYFSACMLYFNRNYYKVAAKHIKCCNCFCLCCPLGSARINQLEAGRSPFPPSTSTPLIALGVPKGRGGAGDPRASLLSRAGPHGPQIQGRSFPPTLWCGDTAILGSRSKCRGAGSIFQTRSCVHQAQVRGASQTGRSLWRWSENWPSLRYWPPG